MKSSMVRGLYICLCLSYTILGQDFSPQLAYVTSQFEKESFDDLIALWGDLQNKPIDLNNPNEIRQLPLLHLMTEIECKQIQDYCQHRELISIYELQGLNIKTETLRRIKRFIRVSKGEIKQPYTHKKSIFAATKFLSQEKLGHTENIYQGSRFKTHFRIRMLISNTWDFVANWEKDPGEPIWYHHEGPNNLAGYICHEDTKKNRKIILGKYDLNLGEGLLFGTSYRINSPYFLSYSPTNTIKATLSAKEYGFLQGLSSQWRKNTLKFGVFVSSRKLHGNRTPDKSGLFRSSKEIQKRKNIREAILGIWIDRTLMKSKISWSGIFYQKENSPKQWLQSLYFSWSYFNINYSGEIATQDIEFWGILQKFNISISNNSLISIQYRNRDYGTFNRYNSDYSHFNHGYEKGVLYSFQHLFNKKWTLNCTFDHYSPNYGKNQTDEILPGIKMAIAVSKVTSNRKVTFKHQQWSGEKSKKKLKLFYQEKLSSKIIFRLKGCYANHNKLTNSSIDTRVGFTNPNQKTKFNLSFGMFNTRNQALFWDSPYFFGNYNSKFNSGKGVIYSFTYRYKWSKSIKYGIQLIQRSYVDRAVIGSGNEQIQGHSKTELSFYLKWAST